MYTKANIYIFTPEKPLHNEASILTSMLYNGATTIHLRHPRAEAAELSKIIRQIPEIFHCHIRLHDHFELTELYNVRLHLNSRNPDIPCYYKKTFSRSCHSIEEIKHYAPTCDYMTLSPIFPSISKVGYKATFTQEQLSAIPTNKVVALGGITPQNIKAISKYNFIGYGALGYIWNSPDPLTALNQLQLCL